MRAKKVKAPKVKLPKGDRRAATLFKDYADRAILIRKQIIAEFGSVDGEVSKTAINQRILNVVAGEPIGEEQKKALRRYLRVFVHASRVIYNKKPGTVKAKQDRVARAQLSENFYETKEWQTLRYKTLLRYGLRCMCCGATNTELHVDHVKPKFRYPELALDPENLQVLCRACNKGKGAWDETDFRPKEVA